jgi:hypothetical protein
VKPRRYRVTWTTMQDGAWREQSIDLEAYTARDAVTQGTLTARRAGGWWASGRLQWPRVVHVCPSPEAT